MLPLCCTEEPYASLLRQLIRSAPTQLPSRFLVHFLRDIVYGDEEVEEAVLVAAILRGLHHEGG